MLKLSLRFVFGALWCVLLAVMVACAAPATSVALNAPTAAPQNNAPTSKPAASAVAPTRAPTNAPTQAPASQPTTVPATTAVEPTTVAEPTAAPEATNAPAPAASAPHAFFGLSNNGEIASNEQIRALAILSGAQMVRTSVTWKQVEGTKGKYNWDWPDKGFKVLTDNHFEPLVLIMDNPEWAATTKCGPVSDLLAYDQFLRALAGRYPNVKYWALYNEPDNAHGVETSTGGCFGSDDIDGNGKPDYQDYAIQLQVAWRAIHSANPDAKLVVGAVAFDNFDEATAPSGYPGAGKGGIFNAHFLEQMFAYMQANPLPSGEKYFDLLGFNFYFIYGPYWEGRAAGKGLTAKANALKQLLQQYGLQADLLVSETGINATTVGNQAQSIFLAQTFARGLSSGVAHIIWWTVQDVADSAAPPTNTWKYGLLDQDANPKPSYAAYQTAAKQLTDADFVQALNVQGGEGFLFNKAGAGVAVVWSLSDAPVSLAFSANVLQVTDVYGATRTVTDNSAEDTDAAVGRISLRIDQTPVYVQAAK